MIHLIFCEVKAWVSLDKVNVFTLNALNIFHHIAILIIDIVQLARFFEDMTAHVEKIYIFARIEVFTLDLHDFGEDRTVFYATFWQQN